MRERAENRDGERRKGEEMSIESGKERRGEGRLIRERAERRWEAN